MVKIEFEVGDNEGDQHAAAVFRIMQLLHRKGAKVKKDKQHIVGSDRVKAYFPDVTATWPGIVVEINGPVGHSSKRSYDNEQNQKKFFNEQNIKFFTYAPTEIVGGWTDSKGRKHKPHSDDELYADWEL